jgi:Carboxypeptidase regulatory-like domain/TonB dependent receptor-like, beta-barrel
MEEHKRQTANRLIGLLAGTALSLLVLIIPVMAQVPTGTIRGTVKDSSGAIVAGATITVRNEDTNQTRVVTSGVDGTYYVPSLLVGHYDVQAERSGFQTATTTGIVLNVSDNLAVNFTLELGATQQRVVVTGEAPQVNTTNGQLGGLVDENQMAELPLNGRNYIDLSLMQAGVTQDKNFGNGGGEAGTSYSSNGASVRSNYFTLDGAPVGTMYARSPASEGNSTLGVDGIKEYRVITNNFPAEYGMAMGSQLVMVSKGGGNQFHGDVFEYLRNNAFDAANFFDRPLPVNNFQRLPPFRRNNFGAAFGGPIKKNKTFFFGVYEGLRQTLGVTSALVVPGAGCHGAAGDTITAAECPQLAPTSSVTIAPVVAPILNTVYPMPNNGLTGYTYPSSDTNREDYGQMRVDQNFSSADSAFARYTIQQGVLDNNGAGLTATPSGSAYPSYRLTGDTRNQFLSLVENHIFSPTVLNTARLSFSRTKFVLASVYTQDLSGPQFSFVPGFPIGPMSIGGITRFAPSSDLPNVYGVQNVYTFSDDLAYMHGRHALKFGMLFNRFNNGLNQGNSVNGLLNFPSLARFLEGIPSLTEVETPGSNQNRDFIWNTLGFYAQDDWRVSSRLTLNLGLRYEFMTQPWELNGRQSHYDSWLTSAAPVIGPVMRDRTHLNFSPRIGFAYDVTGHGTTSIRGGFGIYYDIANIGMALEQTALSSLPFSSLIDVVNFQKAVFTVPFTIPPGNVDNTPQGIDYNAYQPHLVQYNLTVDHQFPANMALSVSYAGSRGAHLWTITDGNPELPSTNIIPGVRMWNGILSHPINPNIGSVTGTTTNSASWYNALEVVLNKRFGHGLQFQSAYTWSKLLDTNQGQEDVSDCNNAPPPGLEGVDPLRPLTDKGPACFDVASDWHLSLLYSLPSIRSGGFLSKVTNGWSVGNIVSIESGYAFTPVETSNRSNSNVLQGQFEWLNYGTATVAPGQTGPNGQVNTTNVTFIPFDKSKVITGNPNQWFNPLMFDLQPTVFDSSIPGADPTNGSYYWGQLGNTGRNILRGPGLGTWDFSLRKDTKVGFLGEAGSIEFRAEFFNLLNRPNFGMPDPRAFLGDPSNSGTYSEAPLGSGPGNPTGIGTVGKITTTATTSRQIQLALKVIF